MKLYTSMKYIGAAVAAMTLSIGASLTMAVPVDFTDSDIKGSYYGLVYGADMTTPVGSLNLKISKKGSFSGRQTSISTGKRSGMKGKMAGDSDYTGEHLNTEGLTSVTDLKVMLAGSGYYRVTGTYTAPDTTKQYFELRRAVYSRAMPATLLADQYTMLIPSAVTDMADIPAGDGLAYGKVKANGKVSLKGYSNAGNKFSFSGAVLDGDVVRFFTQPKNRDIETLSGLLSLRDIVGVSDLDGDLYHIQQLSTKGGYYIDGYSQMLPSVGSRYVRPASSEFPVDDDYNFALTSNALASFVGGVHDAKNYVFTWEPKGKMTAPKQPLYMTSGKMKNSMGYFSGKYVAYDEGNAFVKTKSAFRGVVIQKQSILSGQAITGDVSGRYVIEYNDSGDLAPTTFVSPRKKSASANVAAYVIRIVVESAWQVVIPGDVDWVTVDVASEVGNREILVTLDSNTTGLPREATIYVAGLAHKIKQDFRDDDGAVLAAPIGAVVVLTPVTRLVTDWVNGESYDIVVTAEDGDDWDVTVPVGGAWIQVSPLSGTGNGVVTVTVAPNLIFGTRVGTVLIGGAIHRVTEW